MVKYFSLHLAILSVGKKPNFAVKQPRTHDIANLTHERMKEKKRERERERRR